MTVFLNNDALCSTLVTGNVKVLGRSPQQFFLDGNTISIRNEGTNLIMRTLSRLDKMK